MKLHQTKNSLRERTRRAMIDLLNRQLAAALDLGLQAKQAHWNVKGPNFIGLHELFDKVAEELEDFADDIAERAVELGGVALGTVQVVAKNSTLAAYRLNLVSGQQHVAALSSALAGFGASARTAVDTADRAGGSVYGSFARRGQAAVAGRSPCPGRRVNGNHGSAEFLTLNVSRKLVGPLGFEPRTKRL